VAGDQPLYESRVVLRQFGEHWYPEVVAYYSSGAAEPRETWVLTEARLNDPTLPPLTLADSGIEIGTKVWRMLPHRQWETNEDGSMKFYSFDGEKLVERDEVMKRVGKGELELGPRFVAGEAQDRARLGAYAKALGSRPSSLAAAIEHSSKSRLSFWEEYTREFIMAYRLNDEQAERAWAICKDCQAQARRYLEAHQDRAAEIERLKAAAFGASFTAPQYQEKWNAYIRAKVAFAEPVTRIFDQQLRPRLRKLPTRQQAENATNDWYFRQYDQRESTTREAN
jgi:hypothetical protein